MDFIKNLICPPGKEPYNGKCVKSCQPGKTRNFKTGRCNKIKTSNKTIKSIKSVKSVSMKQIRYATHCPAGKELYNGKCVKVCEIGKSRNPLTGRCVKPKTQKKPLSSRQKPRQNKDIGKNVYQRYRADQETINYLNDLVVNASASKMRKIARDNDLYIPLDEYIDDAKMKEYILNEIFDLAKNHARDRYKTETIRLLNVKYVIDDDIELSAILKGYHPQLPNIVV